MSSIKDSELRELVAAAQVESGLVSVLGYGGIVGSELMDLIFTILDELHIEWKAVVVQEKSGVFSGLEKVLMIFGAAPRLRCILDHRNLTHLVVGKDFVGATTTDAAKRYGWFYDGQYFRFSNHYWSNKAKGLILSKLPELSIA